MDKTQIICGIHWLLCCFIHSFLAHPYVKSRLSSFFRLGNNSYRIIYNVIAFLYLVTLFLYHFQLKSTQVIAPSAPLQVIAICLAIGGLLIMVLSITRYFKQLSGAFKEKQVPELYTGGLNAIVRHPLYFGTFVFLIGLTLYWPMLKNLVAVSIIIIYTLLGIFLEEKKLLREFGKAYKDYQDKVPMILPRLRPKKTIPTG